MSSEKRIEDKTHIIKVDSQKGRGLFTCKSISSGDVILNEEPIASSQFLWNELYNYKACELCLKSLETAEEMARRLSGIQSLCLPYPDCCVVKKSLHVTCPYCRVTYCSESCKDKAWSQYHSVLCTGLLDEAAQHPLKHLCETWRLMHYPPESTSIMLLAKMIASVKLAKDHTEALGKFSNFFHQTVNVEKEIAHKLLGAQYQEQLQVLRSQVTDCLYDDRFPHWFTEEGFQSLFALIGTNGQGIGSSSLSIWVKNCDTSKLDANERTQLDAFIDKLYEDIDEVSGSFLNCEGSGLYPTQSACNHSCVPNAEIQFTHGDYTLSLVALKDINEGEEICISYLGECDVERSRHSRHKILQENYLFICQCDRCLSQLDDEDVTSEEEMDGDDCDDEMS